MDSFFELIFSLKGWAAIGQIVATDGILSGENAAAIAAISMSLSPETRLPRPFAGTKLEHLLGEQRQALVVLGLMGAAILRLVFLYGVQTVMKYVIFMYFAIGILYFLVAKHFVSKYMLHKDGHGHKSVKGASFLFVVATVIMADIGFSLDNVVGVALITPEFALIVVGIMISIFLVVFFARQFQRLIERAPLLEDGAYVVLFVIATEMLLRKAFHIETPEWLQITISASIFTGTYLIERRRQQRLMRMGHDAHVRQVKKQSRLVSDGEYNPKTGDLTLQIGPPRYNRFGVNLGVVFDVSYSTVSKYAAVFGRSVADQWMARIGEVVGRHDSDGHADIWLACLGDRGDGVQHIANYTGVQMRRNRINLRKLGVTPGGYSRILPALQQAYARLCDSATSFVRLIVFSDGRFSDIDDVEKWVLALAARIRDGKATPLKIVFLGAGDVDDKALSRLDHAKLDGIDICDFCLARSRYILPGLRRFSERLDSVIFKEGWRDDAFAVAPSGKILLSDGSLVFEALEDFPHVVRTKIPPFTKKVNLELALHEPITVRLL